MLNNNGICGSYAGVSGALRRLKKKNPNHNPPMPMTDAITTINTWAVANGAGLSIPGVLKFGTMYQNRSTTRMKIMNIASGASLLRFRFKSCDNMIPNGTKKWNMTIKIATGAQPPRIRCRYQPISSGRFADHVIRNCEYEK